MKELYSLLFELSNVDRLNILRELKNNPMRLSRVSEKFDLTVPETARNMTRLNEANLITKDTDGLFHLTPIGEDVLLLLPSFEFISRHEKYFKTHPLSFLPPEYSSNIGALSNSKYVNEITTTLFNIENMMREAEEFLYGAVTEIYVNALPIIAEACARGIEARKLMPRDAIIPPEILKLANDPVFDHYAMLKKLESRYIDKLDIFIAMSEKEVAAIAFRNLEGKYDGASFRSSDPAALNWAKSLFLHYWDSAKR